MEVGSALISARALRSFGVWLARFNIAINCFSYTMVVSRFIACTKADGSSCNARDCKRKRPQVDEFHDENLVMGESQ